MIKLKGNKQNTVSPHLTFPVITCFSYCWCGQLNNQFRQTDDIQQTQNLGRNKSTSDGNTIYFISCFGFPGDSVLKSPPANAEDRFNLWPRKTPHATKLVRHNHWACTPRACALQREKPLQWEVRAQQVEQPLLDAAAESRWAATRTQVNDAEYSSSSYMVGPCCSPILYVVCIS